jgi:hypothetical protein
MDWLFHAMTSLRGIAFRALLIAAKFFTASPLGVNQR